MVQAHGHHGTGSRPPWYRPKATMAQARGHHGQARCRCSPARLPAGYFQNLTLGLFWSPTPSHLTLAPRHYQRPPGVAVGTRPGPGEAILPGIPAPGFVILSVALSEPHTLAVVRAPGYYPDKPTTAQRMLGNIIPGQPREGIGYLSLLPHASPWGTPVEGPRHRQTCHRVRPPPPPGKYMIYN